MISLDYPNYKIYISTLSKPCDMLKIVNDLNLKKYCYAFNVFIQPTKSFIIMNIGMSKGEEIGDRLYRKIGNLPGWGVLELSGKFGSDMKEVVNRTEKKFKEFNLKIHKDDVILHVWDVNNLDVDSFNDPAVEAEKYLMRQYKERFGCMPAGNVQDPCNRNKSISKSHWNSLFDGVDK
jgi:hypothetical protein